MLATSDTFILPSSEHLAKLVIGPDQSPLLFVILSVHAHEYDPS